MTGARLSLRSLPLIFLAGAWTLVACSSSDFSSAGRGKAKDEPTCGKGCEIEVEETSGPKAKTVKTVKDVLADGKVVADPDSIVAKSIPRFGMLANDAECAFCHVKINGDIISTADVPALWNYSVATITGAWKHAGSFNANVPDATNRGQNVSITATDGIKPLDPAVDLAPKDRDGDGRPDFPTLDFSTIGKNMLGSVKQSGIVKVDKIADDNTILIGTAADPLVIDGEVLIKGDLVIKGIYRGMGNIYVTGNIYVPGDIIAVKTPFPYSENRAQALQQATESLARKDDALALASAKSIFVSDFETHGPGNSSVFEHINTPLADRAEALGMRDIYSWYPGGANQFDQLFDSFEIGCVDPNRLTDNGRSISRVDAFLYAVKAIGGRASRNSYSINGGIIADHFHIISTAMFCPPGVHPIHKQDQQYSHINYDWRMQVGLLLLKQFATSFVDADAE